MNHCWLSCSQYLLRESNEATLKPCSGTSWMKMFRPLFYFWHETMLKQSLVLVPNEVPIWPAAPRTPLHSLYTGEEVSSPNKYASCDQSQSSPRYLSPLTATSFWSLDQCWPEWSQNSPFYELFKAKQKQSACTLCLFFHTVLAHGLPIIKTTAYFRQLK